MRGLTRLWTAKFAIAVACASWPAFAQTGPGWTTAWGTSQQALGQARVSNATLRLVARVTAPGDAIRLRFDNTFGTAPVNCGDGIHPSPLGYFQMGKSVDLNLFETK